MRAHCRAAAYARVAELADAYGSGPYGETRGGSSPLASTKPLLTCNGANTNATMPVWIGLVTSSLRLSFWLPTALSLARRAFFARLA